MDSNFDSTSTQSIPLLCHIWRSCWSKYCHLMRHFLCDISYAGTCCYGGDYQFLLECREFALWEQILQVHRGISHISNSSRYFVSRSCCWMNGSWFYYRTHYLDCIIVFWWIFRRPSSYRSRHPLSSCLFFQRSLIY